MSRHRVHLWALAASLLAGCAATPAAKFYTLTASAAAGALPSASPVACRGVGVGPVWIPDEVDRPQIVLRLGANRVAIDEHQRWAAPLQSGIQLAVVENLSRLLGSVAVVPYPEGIALDPDCRLEIQVLRFDSTPGATASLEVLWMVRRAKGGPPRAGRTRVDEPLTASGVDALVAAHSRALERLSRDLADALRLP